MNTKQALQGITILNTRPSHQAHQLTRLIEELGGTVLQLPCIAIEHYPATTLTTTINELPPLDLIVFVSANAVHATMSSHWHIGDTPIIAIGQGTAQALRQYQQAPLAIPDETSSNGLLAMPELQHIDSQHIALCCGNNTKPLLKNTLRQRGATVHTIECYHRTQPPVPQQHTLKQLYQNQLDAIISTSTESLNNLVSQLKDLPSEWLITQQLVVINDAMARQAMQLGWQTTPWIASQSSDQAVIDCLLKNTNKEL